MNYQKPTEHIEEEDVKRLDFVTNKTILQTNNFTTNCFSQPLESAWTRKVLFIGSSYTMLGLDSVL